MNLVTVLADRRAATSCKDPDTLHGILFSLETKQQRAQHQTIIDRMMPNLTLIERARAGNVGRVPAFQGEKDARQVREFPDGLFPLRWKRDLISTMLSAEGITTPDLSTMLHECGATNMSTAEAMRVIRTDLRPFSVDVEAVSLEHGEFSYRIVGRSAWRMQNIISNGWSV